MARATGWVDRESCMRLSDGLAAAFAVALPWSTSAATILSVLWLIAVIPTFDGAELRRIVLMPVGGLPVLLVVLLVIGMLWAAGVPLGDRWGGLKSALKFLYIPLLIAHFARSERGWWVMAGFIASCVVLLAASWIILLDPDRASTFFLLTHGSGVPVRDYIAQSSELTLCIFLLAPVWTKAWRQHRRFIATVLALIGALFLIDMFSISTSRTALVVLPVLILLFSARYFSRVGTISVVAASIVVGLFVVEYAPQVRSTVTNLFDEVRDYRPDGARTRAGERIEFWTKSVGFIADAPLFGHGTGSIRNQFGRVLSGEAATNDGALAANPHNQTLAVGIQLGFVGAAVLFAFWLSHLMLFWRGSGFAAWAGLVIVMQNIVGSLFNSHLFDFVQGWLYVLGVGVAAGAMLKTEREQAP